MAEVGHLPSARVVYRGKLTGKFCDNVRQRAKEGVVCMGGSGSADLWMVVKTKPYAYMEKL